LGDVRSPEAAGGGQSERELRTRVSALEATAAERTAELRALQADTRVTHVATLELQLRDAILDVRSCGWR
jgi:hypothetical protein